MRYLSFSRPIAQNSWTSLIIHEALARTIQTLRPCQLGLVTKKMQGKHFRAYFHSFCLQIKYIKFLAFRMTLQARETRACS